MRPNLPTYLLLITLAPASAHAALWDRGGGLIYDDVLDVTWLQDANYAKTSGHDDDGQMTWSEAMTWVIALDYYDEVSGLLLSDWRLPVVAPLSGAAFNPNPRFDGKSDVGYNISAPGTLYAGSRSSELAYMFYNNLQNVAYFNLSGVGPQENWESEPSSEFTDSAHARLNSFGNLQSPYYWSQSAYDADSVWSFYMSRGEQTYGSKEQPYFSWPVLPGDVADVRAARHEMPTPTSSWLILAGIVGYLMVRLRNRSAHRIRTNVFS